MIEIRIKLFAGEFAENKDQARAIRIEQIVPALKRNEEITISFEGVTAATQSFIHALISDLIRQNGIEALNLIAFKDCNETVKKIIEIVVEYMQEGEY